MSTEALLTSSIMKVQPTSFKYFIDPQIFSELTDTLDSALHNLSTLPLVTFWKVTELKDLYDHNIDMNQHKHHSAVGTPIIVCLANEFPTYENSLLQDCPPDIVTPLWVLGSALCRHLQPKVYLMWHVI